MTAEASQKWVSVVAAIGLSAFLAACGQLGCASDRRAPELFGGPLCDQERGWTGEELAQLAFRYVGYETAPRTATIRYWQQGYEITIHVSLNTLHAGAFFQVLVSAKDGSLLSVVRGE